ncbi:MAG: hypothetical protein Q9160_002758 [Pyrenula sp. 1 TL-2023]
MAFPKYTATYHDTSYPSISPTNPSLSAEGRTVIVSGAAGAIGSATIKAFATARATKFAILGRTESTLLTTKTSIKASFPGTEVSVHVTDVASESSVANAAEDIKRQYGTWDVFISNAGYLPDMMSMVKADIDEWWRGFEINVKSGVLIAKHFVPFASKNATLISVNSAAAHLTIPELSSYAASKMAAARVFEYIAAENPDLRVFSLQPGVIKSAMSEKTVTGGLVLPHDDSSLPADFMVWLASPESEAFRGRYLWSNWDVDELKKMAEEVKSNNELVTALAGWPKAEAEA